MFLSRNLFALPTGEAPSGVPSLNWALQSKRDVLADGTIEVLFVARRFRVWSASFRSGLDAG